jgi:hypothetical protein
VIAVRTAIALIGGLLLLIGAAGFDVERRKPDGSPTLALAFALIGAAVFVVAVWT